MRDKICIVTAGTRASGRPRRGPREAGRDGDHRLSRHREGKAARDEIAGRTGSKELHVMQLDLASLKSVRAFAAAFTAKYARLDVLVENAGVSTGKRQLTADGLEADFGVNHVGHFLLTDLLLPLLKSSAPSRIVVVSSSVHTGAKLDFDDLQGEKLGQHRRLRQIEARQHALRARAREAPRGTKVVVNALHPGVISTELARDFPRPCA